MRFFKPFQSLFSSSDRRARRRTMSVAEAETALALEDERRLGALDGFPGEADGEIEEEDEEEEEVEVEDEGGDGRGGRGNGNETQSRPRARIRSTFDETRSALTASRRKRQEERAAATAGTTTPVVEAQQEQQQRRSLWSDIFSRGPWMRRARWDRSVGPDRVLHTSLRYSGDESVGPTRVSRWADRRLAAGAAVGDNDNDGFGSGSGSSSSSGDDALWAARRHQFGPPSVPMSALPRPPRFREILDEDRPCATPRPEFLDHVDGVDFDNLSRLYVDDTPVAGSSRGPVVAGSSRGPVAGSSRAPVDGPSIPPIAGSSRAAVAGPSRAPIASSSRAPVDGPSIPPVAGSSRAPVAGCSRAPAPFPSPADLDPALTPWEAAGFYPPADDTDADSALSEGGRERLAGFWKVAVREFWLGCSWGSRGRRYLRPAELEQVTTGCTALFGVPRRHWCPPCHRELGEQTLEYLPVEPGTRMPAYTPSSSSGVPLSPSVLSRASSIARGWRREAPGDGDGDSVRIGPVGAVSSSAHSSIYRDGPDIFNRGSSVFGHHSTSAEDRERRRRPPSSLDNRSSSLFHSCRVASTVSFAGVISESGVPGSPPPFPFPAPDVFTDDIRGGGHDGTGPLGISFSRALELLGELNELSEMQDSKRAGSGGSVRTEGEGELLADDNGLYPLERVWAQSEPRTPTEEAAAPPRDSGLLAGLRRRAVKWGRALASRGSSSRQKRKGEEGAEPGGEDEKAGEEERGAAGEEAAAIRGEMMTPAQWLAGAGAAR